MRSVGQHCRWLSACLSGDGQILLVLVNMCAFLGGRSQGNKDKSSSNASYQQFPQGSSPSLGNFPPSFCTLLPFCPCLFSSLDRPLLVYITGHIPCGPLPFLTFSTAVFRPGDDGLFWYAVISGSLEMLHCPNSSNKACLFVHIPIFLPLSPHSFPLSLSTSFCLSYSVYWYHCVHVASVA